MTLRFADCRLDLDARRLVRGADEVSLTPKAFTMLRLLVEGRPRAFSKSELLEHIWPGVFVSEASLARVINELRSAVGDDASTGRIIRTIYAYGYAFAATVEEDASARMSSGDALRPAGWLTGGAREFALWEGDQIIGRDASADVRLDSPKVSRQHARITIHGVRVTIEDLGSKNGTQVGGAEIGGPTGLSHGDTVRVGPFNLVLTLASAFGRTETQVQ